MSKKIGRRAFMAQHWAIPCLRLGLAVLLTAGNGEAGPSGGLAGPRRQALSASSARLDLTVFLPRAGEVPGWIPKGEPLVYSGEDLFTYIDGGADIYNEYGFRQVAVQDYESSPQKTVTLEVFEMADAAAAFGMFTFKTSARGSEIDLGQGGRLEDYYLNFWKGPVVVTVTGFDESPESVEAVLKLAEAANGKFRTDGEKPSLAAAFPPEWAARGGLKYLRGPIGLRNQHPVFFRQAIRFHEGVAGWPAEGVLAVVLKGQAPAEAKTAFSDVEKLFSPSPPFTGYRSADGRLEARDARGNVVQVRLLDGCLALLVTKGPTTDSDKIWQRLRGAFAGDKQ